jgi:hypothetical protein
MTDASDLDRLAESGAPLAEQRVALLSALKEKGFSAAIVDLIDRYTVDGVVLQPGHSEARSRIGGQPLLPDGIAWPELVEGEWSLAFLFALYLDELPGLVPLPGSGVLVGFQETETMSAEWDPLVGTRLFYVEHDSFLRACEPPENSVVTLSGCAALRGVAVPIPGSAKLALESVDDPADREALIAAMNELYGERFSGHQLLGAPQEIHAPLQVELPEHLMRLSPAHRQRFNEEELAGHGWRLLLQFGQVPDADFFIGNAGAFYLLIPEVDLRVPRFDRVVGIMQSR